MQRVMKAFMQCGKRNSSSALSWRWNGRALNKTVTVSGFRWSEKVLSVVMRMTMWKVRDRPTTKPDSDTSPCERESVEPRETLLYSEGGARKVHSRAERHVGESDEYRCFVSKS
jgi:hypothetical protein